MSSTHALKTARSAAAANPSRCFEDLLVFQDESTAAANALRYARDLVAPADGHIVGLMFGLISPYPSSVYMEAAPDIWAASQERAAKEADAVEERLKVRIAAHAPGTELRRKDVIGGDAGRILAIHGRYADAVVLGWTRRGALTAGDRDGTELERDLFDSVLFETGRPILLVPEDCKAAEPPRRILVAWSPEREATRAVHDALPLLKQAELVTILAVADGRSRNGEEDPGADIARHLARHDVRTEVKHVPSAGRTAHDVIKSESRYCGADLVVLGGYGHSRLSQWILGGVTRDMLADLTTPTMFSH